MTPYRVSARQDTTATDQAEVQEFSRTVRGPVALRASLVLLVSLAFPAVLFWHQWITCYRSFLVF